MDNVPFTDVLPFCKWWFSIAQTARLLRGHQFNHDSANILQESDHIIDIFTSIPFCQTFTSLMKSPPCSMEKIKLLWQFSIANVWMVDVAGYWGGPRLRADMSWSKSQGRHQDGERIHGVHHVFSRSHLHIEENIYIYNYFDILNIP